MMMMRENQGLTSELDDECDDDNDDDCNDDCNYDRDNSSYELMMHV